MGCIGGVILLAIVAAIIVPVAAGIFSAVDSIDTSFGTDSSSSSDFDISGEDAVVLPGEPAAPADVVALTSIYDSDSSAVVYRVARLTVGDDEPRWFGPPLDEGTYQVLLAHDATSIYYGDGAAVVAVDLASGAQRWRTPVSDVVSWTCGARCLQTVAGKVLVTTSDGVLVALDAASGAESWQRRMVDSRGSAMVVGERVLVIDGTGAEHDVIVLSPADGAEISRFRPVCLPPDSFGSSRDVDPDGPVIALGDGTAVLGYGTWPGCWERWDLGTGSRIWQAMFEDTSFSTDLIEVHDDATLVTQDSNGGLIVVDLGNGQARVVPGVADQSLVPAAVRSDLILAWAESTRGSRPWTLQAFDPGSLAVRFDHDLGGAAPALPGPSATLVITSGESRVAAGLGGSTVDLVTFTGETSIFSSTTLDASTGTAGPSVDAEVQTDDIIASFIPLRWRGPRLVALVNEGIVEVDASTGTVTGHG